MNDTSSLLQTVPETINIEKSELDIELNNIYKNGSLVPNIIIISNYEVVADDEDYIFYKEEKYTIDEFLENQQKEIESLYNDNHLLNNYLFHKYKKIHEGILALQKDINNLENWYLRGSLENINGGNELKNRYEKEKQEIQNKLDELEAERINKIVKNSKGG
ncbi:5315_t:CDS:2, partial [Gigaspora margarita]